MRVEPIPFVGGSYADETRPWSQQDTVNYLPCLAETSGTMTPAMLKTPPGLSPFIEVAPTGGGEVPEIPSPPVRGIYNVEGKLFVVIGTILYSITGTTMVQIGTIPGIGRVTFAHNQIALGNEVVIFTGPAGYCYNTVTQVFGRITDSGFPGSSVGVFIDGYIVGIDPQGQFAFNSAPAAATDYNTLDRFTSEVSPDKLIGIASSNNELLLLSTRTGEFFENTGASEQPFRSKRISMDKGCAGAYTVVEADNTVFWLGNDGYFYKLEGYSPRRISKRPLEQAIRGLNWSQCFGYLWEDAGHTVVYWTFPDGRTWGYDASNGEWHRRESYGLDRWRVNCMARWRDAWYAGDFQTGRIWALDWDYILEGDEKFISSRTCPAIYDGQNAVQVPRIELVMDTGQQITEAGIFIEQPVGPSITGSAPDGVKYLPYGSYAYIGTGGTGSLTYTISSGALPPGLSLNSSNGQLTGTPTEDGSFGFVVRVTDSNGFWDEVADSVAVTASVMALVSEGFVFTGDPLALVQSVPTGLSTIYSRSLSISPSSRFIAAGSVSSPFLYLQEIKPDLTGYDTLPAQAYMPSDDVRATAFTDDGRYLAIVEVDGVQSKITVYRIDGNVFTKVSEKNTLYIARTAAWNPQGTRLAIGQDYAAPNYGLMVFPFEDESLGTAIPGANTQSAGTGVASLQYSRSGQYLVGGSSNYLTVWRELGGVMSVVCQNSSGSLAKSNRGAVISNDENYVYAVAATQVDGHLVSIYGFTGSSLTGPIYPADEPISSLTPTMTQINSDGTALAIAMGGDGSPNDYIWVYAVDGGTLSAADNPATSELGISSIAWTPSGVLT